MPHSAFLSHDFEIGADLLKVRIGCQHPYYKDSVCPDLSFELSTPSKGLLHQSNILFKEKGHILEFARKKKDDNDVNFGTGLPDLPIDILVRVNNPRFWLVTDFTDIKKNSGEPLLFELKKNKNNQFIGKNKARDKEKALEYGFPSPFAVLFLNLNNIVDAKEIVLSFAARQVTLKYKLFPPAKKLKNGEHLFKLLRKQPKVKEARESGITLKVNWEDQKVCVLTSTNNWTLHEENLHKNKGYFKFEFKSEEVSGNVELFLPFPGRITSRTIRKDKIEQEVRLPKFYYLDPAKPLKS